MRHLGYRHDIDGLRAIAVGSVVLFHAFPSLLPGGFVGVDIFFVISGFLITSMIIQSIENKEFSLLDFYERRARRILPALIVMIIVTSIVAYIILWPRPFQQFGRSAIASLLSLSNVWFWYSQDYFSQAAELEPLLHTWSLGVEEQFYIVVPLIVMLVSRFGRPAIFLAVGLVVLASFTYSALGTPASPTFAFYMILTRAFELGIGSLLALLVLQMNDLPEAQTERWRTTAQVGGALGIMMVFASFLLFDSQTIFPGVAALMPSAGTALVILSGYFRRGWLYEAMSLKPSSSSGWFRTHGISGTGRSSCFRSIGSTRFTSTRWLRRRHS